MAENELVTSFETLENYAVANIGGDIDIQEIITENLGSQKLTFLDLERIKVPSGGSKTWTVMDQDGDEIDTDVINGIILDFISIRQYFTTAYDGSKNPPDCMSFNGLNGEGNPGGSCLSCPNAKFGTKKDQSGNFTDGQACAERMILFILTEGSILPSCINVPPTGLKETRQFLTTLTSKHFVPKYGCITEFRLKKDKSNTGIEYSKIDYKKGETLSKDEREFILKYRESIMPTLSQEVQETVKDTNLND